jgi:2'-5' RNA ligase
MEVLKNNLGGPYSLIVKPPDNVVARIVDSVRIKNINIAVRNPHLSLGMTFNCGGKVRERIKDWLGAQTPFNFTLSGIDTFPPGRLYLTSGRQDELDCFEGLIYGTEQILQTDMKYRPRNGVFIPHMTMYNFVPKEIIKEVKSKFYNSLNPPLVVPINRVEIQKKIASGEYITLDSVTIGSGETRSGNRWNLGQKSTVDGCQLPESRRSLRPQFCRP